MTRLLSLLLGLALAPSLFALPEGVDTLAIGANAPDFNLLGIDGKKHTLAEYADKDVLAVLFTCNHCPTAQAAEARVIQMVKDYAGKSFQLVAISPNDPSSLRIDEMGYSLYGDTYEEMKAHAKEYGFNFPYLYDGDTQATAKAYGAIATPHIFIFDKARQLRYQGRIDDSKFAEGVTKPDARNAIDALLAGEAVPVETTRAFGCSTKWAYKTDTVGETEAAWKERPVTAEEISADGIKALVKNDTQKLRMINLWATWCGPCVEEFPDLVKLGRQFQNRGFDFITISLDGAAQAHTVQEFLESEHAALPKRTEPSVKKEGRTTNNYIYDSSDLDALAAAVDSEWDGGIPYTIIIAPGGKVIYRSPAGPIEPMEVRKVVLKEIGRFYTE